jgi:dihydrodiol dehydrogenase / D-xylose 1-dehydrogenase (NADP)
LFPFRTYTDVVYIGAINTAHFEIGMLMLDHGKHVLCEKPLCLNEKQAKKLLSHAKAKKLFFMEAIWSRFFPSYIYLRDRIEKGDLGEIKEVEVEFGFALSDVERMNSKALGGGTILDLGVYTIQVSQWAFRQEPIKIVATGSVNADGVDMEMKGELHYPNGGVARMCTSGLEEKKNTATIRGTKGSITVRVI